MSGQFYVYILQSHSTGRFYVGQTQDLPGRLLYHNRYGNRFTRNRGPWQLVYREVFATRSEALRRERELKRKKSRRILQRLVSASR